MSIFLSLFLSQLVLMKAIASDKTGTTVNEDIQNKNTNSNMPLEICVLLFYIDSLYPNKLSGLGRWFYLLKFSEVELKRRRCRL